ncbi:hypothetical protein LINPERHAP2_LOCUS9626 [Linum perenne]
MQRFKFRFENFWADMSGMKEVVETSWKIGELRGIKDKLKGCAEALTDWSKKNKVHFEKEIKQARKQLEELRHDNSEDGAKEYERQRKELLQLLHHEEKYWKQRAKHYWMKDGERNKKYFHRVASGKKK